MSGKSADTQDTAKQNTHGSETRIYSEATRGRLNPAKAPAIPAGPPPKGLRPQHHLAGLYLDEIFRRLIEEVGKSETPLEAMMSMIVDLPVDMQRDLLCGCLREVRKQVQSTAVREIGEKAYSDATQPPTSR